MYDYIFITFRWTIPYRLPVVSTSPVPVEL